MVLSQSPRPVLQNPYAKRQAKRPRRDEAEERKTSTAGANLIDLTAPKNSSDAPQVNSEVAVVPPNLLASPVKETVGAVKQRYHEKRERKQPPINPYRKQACPEISSQCSSVVASPGSSATSVLEMRPAIEKPNEMDTSIDWTAAAIELDGACTEKESSSVLPRNREHSTPMQSSQIQVAPINSMKCDRSIDPKAGLSNLKKPPAPLCSDSYEQEFDSGIDWDAAIQEIDAKTSGGLAHSEKHMERSSVAVPEKRCAVVDLTGNHDAAVSATSIATNTHSGTAVAGRMANFKDTTVSQPTNTAGGCDVSLTNDELQARRPDSSGSTVSQRANDLVPRVVGQKEEVGSVNSLSSKSLGHDMRPSSWMQRSEPSQPSSSNSADARSRVGSVHATKQSATPSAASSVQLSQNHGMQSQLQQLPPQLRYSPKSVQPVADEYRATLIKNAELSSPLLNGWSLYPHQKQAILKGLVMRRIILALDMGLGKTLIGCVWSRAFFKTFPELKVYVICPVSLKTDWQRTAEKATGLKVVDEGKSKKEEGSGMRICSWAKIPSPASTDDSDYVVVCDEAHSMQSMQSVRTKNALKLVSSKRCLGVLLLTGTPMKNGKPLNLFPLLRAVRHPFGNHQKSYEIHFCAGREKSYGTGRPVWDANGSANLPQLRSHVSSHLLHMTKEQCLADLPSQTRLFRKVPVCSRHQIRHDNALNDLARLYQTSQYLENSGDAILGAVQRVRQIGSFAKIDATVALAKSVLEEEPAVVVFTSFVQVAETVHKQLAESGWDGELLTGETPPKKRQGMVDNFQAGLSPVFVCTFGAGGVGLTLTAAHTVILLDRPWTPGDALQAEDRVRRIGQTKPVKSIWVVAFDLDQQIDSVLEQKSQNSNAVLVQGPDGDGSASAAPAPKISIFQLLRSVLPKQGMGNTI